MKRIAKCLVMAAVVAALLLVMLPSMPAATEPFAVDYLVRFSEASSVISVRMDFAQAETDPFNLLPLYAGPDIALPDGYFRNLEARDTEGNPLTVTSSGSVWTVSGGTSGTITYSVDLAAFEGLPPEQYGVNNPVFSPFLPHWDDVYAFAPGYCVFLMPVLGTDENGGVNEPSELNVSYELPEGWEAWSIDNESPAQVIGSAVFAGNATAVEADGEMPLTVVQQQDADAANLAAQQEFADRLSAQSAMAEQAWGGVDMGDEGLLLFLGSVRLEAVDNVRLLSISLDPFYECAFVPVGTRENILSTDFLLRAGDASMRVMLGAMSLEPSALWFREGCIHYSNLRFAQRNQWISEDGVYDRLGTAYASYVDALGRSGTSLAGAGEQALLEPAAGLLYSGGTIAATSIDVRLDEAGKSLDEFIASLLPDSSGEALTNQHLQDQLEAYSGVSFDSFFEDYVTGTGTIPASSFSELKLGQETVEIEVENPVAPAPGFGNRWILIVVAIGVVFALPFVLEPYTLKPRGGAVPVEEDEADEGMKARRGSWWSWDDDDDEEVEGEEDEDEEGDEPEARPRPEGYE